MQQTKQERLLLLLPLLLELLLLLALLLLLVLLLLLLLVFLMLLEWALHGGPWQCCAAQRQRRVGETAKRQEPAHRQSLLPARRVEPAHCPRGEQTQQEDERGCCHRQ